jgi:hypothetical protein
MRIRKEKVTREQAIRAIELGLILQNESTAEDIKKQLLALARSGAPRPESGTTLGTCLGNYTRHTQSCYDGVFDDIIRKIAPHWFVLRQEIAQIKKTLLLVLARYGVAKPTRGTKLGGAIKHFTSKHSTAFDEEFNKEIRSVCPEWFSWVADSKTKKGTLLEMAKNGGKRPSGGSLMYALEAYTRAKDECYDPQFDEEIRATAPHWFMSVIRGIRKKELLCLAIAGEDKPRRGTPLGEALRRLVCPGLKTYDDNFFDQISGIAQNWFKK